MINKESIHMMKEGVILINCARGSLAGLDALIAGIEGILDMAEHEKGQWEVCAK